MMKSATFETALQYHRNGNLAQAESAYRQLLNMQPNNADALHLLGVLCYQTERYAEAIQLIEKAIKISPRDADYLNNYGLALRANGQSLQAINAYQKAMLISPKDMDIQLNLANALHEAERFEEAVGCYRRVWRFNQELEVRDALTTALQALGNLAQQAGKYAQAQACYEEALQYNPKDEVSHYNLGNALREQGKAKEAAVSYQRAIKLNPKDADAHNNLGNVQRELGMLAEAIQSYEAALKLNPNLYHAKVHLVHQKQHICDWSGLDEAVTEIRDWVAHQPQAQISPFAFLAIPGTNAAEQKQCAENWLANRYASLLNQPKKYAFELKHKNKLRIGYLSADFRLHPLAYLISELIELHNREKFEIFAYSYGPDDQSKERLRLQKAFDHFVDIRKLSLQEAADKIYADNIDILVDLTGFTQSSRTNIVALRPAPISINWLGYPGTMGTGLFDFMISDAFITPPESAENYAEQLLLMPDCYQPNDRHRPIGETPTRAQYQLPEDAFVFCCFNQSFKILPEIFKCWMEILAQTPNSVLWLLECNSIAKNNLLAEAQKCGIEVSRLIFAPRVSIADHLARHLLADLFLDTTPYNAHTTTSDALWMGLPVLTLLGNTFSSRVAGSLLNAANLNVLVVNSLADYQSKAIEIANTPELIKDYKKQLTNKCRNSDLFNTEKMTRDLESLYETAWKKRLQEPLL